MKSHLKKLRDLAVVHQKEDSKEKKRRNPSVPGDEFAQALQDMNDMKDCYEALLSAAAAISNSAYEFSEALKELGTCLLQKTSLGDDEESGRVLLKIGKGQFELQKLVNNYRSHVVQTITTPSESLLTELRTVEEMKRQCDEKRMLLDYMLASNKEKGRVRNSKLKSSLSQQLQQAHEAYEEETTLFVFRLKSMKQSQSRSFLTQAIRHHAAQLNFLNKGSKILEAVEPEVKLIAEQQRINYRFNELDDDGSEEDDDYSYDTNNDSELSFDHEQTEQQPSQNIDSTSQSSMEENIDKSRPSLFRLNPIRHGSYSAPIFPDKKIDFEEKLKEFQHSKKFHSYVLPTPSASKSLKAVHSDAVHVTRLASTGEKPTQWRYSLPLKEEKMSRGFLDAQVHASLQSSEIQENRETSEILPPLPKRFSLPKLTVDVSTDAKKFKRQYFSGPLLQKAWPSNAPSSSSHIIEHSSKISAMPIHNFTQHPSSRRNNSGASQSPMSSPIISELHELPRPPSSSARSVRQSCVIGRSAPSISRNIEDSITRRSTTISTQKASPLPEPPGTITRCFSIPSSSQRMSKSFFSRLSEVQISDTDVIASTMSPIDYQPSPERDMDADDEKHR